MQACCSVGCTVISLPLENRENLFVVCSAITVFHQAVRALIFNFILDFGVSGDGQFKCKMK